MTTVAEGSPSRGRIEDLLSLLDELIEVTKYENELLLAGWPASQLIPFQRKAELAEQFQPWAVAAAKSPAAIFTADRKLYDRLIERLNELQALTTENVLNLRAAIEASQRRINAVMAAIREQIAADAQYSANGYACGSTQSSYVANLRV
jgi:hypothetical protein